MTVRMLIEDMKVCGAPLFLTALLTLGACADTGGYKIDMMPSPEVYEE